MFEYTSSSIKDTLDLIKRTIYFSNLVIQFLYIFYLVFRFYNQIGYLFANIILLVVSVFYLFYIILKTGEFNTKEENKSKKFVRSVVKNIKRILYIYLIVLATSQLYFNPTDNDNILILMTALMIFGFLLSIFFDLILMNIDQRFEIITNSMSYDIKRLKIEKKAIATMFEMLKKTTNFDIDELIPKIEEEKMIKVIKDINHKQKNKKMRKRSFKAIKRNK